MPAKGYFQITLLKSVRKALGARPRDHIRYTIRVEKFGFFP